MREVLSYARRGSRLTPKQQSAWETHGAWVLSDTALADGVLWGEVFGRQAPLVIEIGSGVGEATVATAVAHPDLNVLSIEVWRPGVAEALGRVGEARLTNVRFSMLDAVWLLRERVSSGQLSEVHTFFPDPWHKKRHHKRRLIDADFGQLVADRLTSGGVWRIATDWSDYAEFIAEALDDVTGLQGGLSERWAGRPLTKFERKGLKAGREISDFTFVKV